MEPVTSSDGEPTLAGSTAGGAEGPGRSGDGLDSGHAGSGGPGGTGARAGAVDAAADVPDCSCSEARAHLEVFLDRECSQDMSERLAQHVATCDRCSRLADAETHLRAILRSRCAEQAPPELRARVLGRLSMIRATSTVVSTASTVSVAASSSASRVVLRTVETRSVGQAPTGPAGRASADGLAPASWGYRVSRTTWAEGR